MLKARPIKDKPKLKRRLVFFCTPPKYEPSGEYHVGFCYYRQGKYRDEYAGITEEVYLTENELYEILKPRLIINND